jgi:hypothetical protein
MDYADSRGRTMSEALPKAVDRLDAKKYIDQMQDELKKIARDVGSGRTPEEVEKAQTRLQNLLRKQSQEIAKELGLTGNHIFVFMIASTLLTTAWTSFYIRTQMDDISKPFEERIRLTDMLNSLELALGNVISAGTRYAEVYGKK